MKQECGRWRSCAYSMGLAVLVAAPAWASDELGPYIGGALGAGRPVAVQEDKLGILPALSAGYAFQNGLRPELELSYRYNSKYDVSEHATSAMANTWYDFWHEGYYFYAGGGLGGTKLDTGGSSSTLASWQLGLGFGRAITQHLALGLDFRHLASFDQPKFTVDGQSTEGPHYMTSAILLELRYSFGGGLQNPALLSK